MGTNTENYTHFPLNDKDSVHYYYRTDSDEIFMVI